MRRCGRAMLAAAVLVGAASLHAQVSFDRLLNARAEPHNWLTYSGDTFN